VKDVPNMSRKSCSLGADIGMPQLHQPLQPASGHVFRVERKRGPVWYAKYRLPDGRQVQRKIGSAWTARGRPLAGYLTKRSAEAWLGERLHEARRGTLPGMIQTGRAQLRAVNSCLRRRDRRWAAAPRAPETRS
jgi:hypothetical protein